MLRPLCYPCTSFNQEVRDGKVYRIRKALQKEAARAERKAPEFLGRSESRNEKTGKPESIQQSESTEVDS